MDTPTKPNTPTPAGASPSAGQCGIAASTLLRSQSAKKAAMLRQQRDRLFDEAASGMVPERAQKQPEDPLKPWWPQIKRKINEGYSIRQIRTMVQSPKIGLNVTVRSLKQFIEEHTKAQSAAPSGK